MMRKMHGEIAIQPITTDRLLELVGELYEAALDPTTAPQVMEALIDALKANMAQQQSPFAGTDARMAATIREESMLQRRLASRVPTDLDAEGLLAALPMGGVLLDAGGRLIGRNTAASGALSDLSLRCAGGFLRFDGAEPQRLWLRTLACVVTEHLPRTLVPATKTGSRWRLHLIPLQYVATTQGERNPHPVLAVFEREPICAEHKRAALRTRYRLTEAQSDVLTQLLTGACVKQIARRRDTSVNTIRTQLKDLFEKVGCHSQRELLTQLQDA